MQHNIPSESSEVPGKIVGAERWRVAGETIRQLAPELFEDLFAMLVASTIGLSERDQEKITESYFVT